MRYPLWILNSSLLFLTLLVLAFAFFSRQRVPYREAIAPEEGVPTVEREGVKINISKIYEHDLFGTYVKEMPLPEEAEASGETLPTPPTPKAPHTPEIPRPQFLEPLNITLKGIIVFVHDSGKNTAIIENNQTKQEAAYKLGDMIEDAQLIRILSNKVLFLRSNGQQEILYLKEHDAKEDPAYAAINSWNDIIKQTAPSEFTVDKYAFIERVANLGSFIDHLSLTSVYKKGISVGCRVGQLAKDSLGKALGLEQGDLIISVNGIPATSSENRLSIYKGIVKNNQLEPIRVELMRGNQPYVLLYTIMNAAKLSPVMATSKYAFLQNRPLQVSYNNSYDASLEEMRAREQSNMLHMSTKPREETL